MSVINRFERIMLQVAPGWVASRASSRMRVQAMQTAFDAVNPGRFRNRRRDMGNGNAITESSQKALRDIARDLDRNHDLSRGALNVLVRNVVGPTGIGVEPQPSGADGQVDRVMAKKLADLWQRWGRYPEVTAELNWARSEQLLCRSWMRDGEGLWQYLDGSVPKLTHASGLPFSVELLECDLVPMDYSDPQQNISQGIEVDAWGRPQAFWVYKQHPAEPFVVMPELKRVPTDSVGHLKLIDRIGQRRGLSIFASVLNRLDDLKDYEESERIAARIAASLAAVIKKGDATSYGEAGTSADGVPNPARNIPFQPGMVLDALNPGEDVSIIDSKRPNPNALLWRNGQLRAVSAGTDVSYSSLSRNYDGSYSAQRQELVEGWSAYAVLSHAFIDMCTSEVYRRFVAAMVLSGQISAPRGVSFDQLCQCVYVPPSMPWIDPVKEVDAYQSMESSGYISGPEVIRKQGRNPQEVLRAQEQWLKDKAAAGIQQPTSPSSTDAPATVQKKTVAAPATEEDA